MKHFKSTSEPRALVTVFDELESAQRVLDRLQQDGFAKHRVHLVHRDIRRESPEVETPKVHETTSSAMTEGVMKGAGIGLGFGAGFGVAATVLTASPGLALGAMIYAGFAGGLIGGMGGIDRADIDDTVNLPSLDEYQQLVDQGHYLVVVQGDHDEVMRAESIMKQMTHLGSHVHRLHGHLFHEHPSHPESNSSPPRK
jgi:hypothetical protein